MTGHVEEKVIIIKKNAETDAYSKCLPALPASPIAMSPSLTIWTDPSSSSYEEVPQTYLELPERAGCGFMGFRRHNLVRIKLS